MATYTDPSDSRVNRIAEIVAELLPLLRFAPGQVAAGSPAGGFMDVLQFLNGAALPTANPTSPTTVTTTTDPTLLDPSWFALNSDGQLALDPAQVAQQLVNNPDALTALRQALGSTGAPTATPTTTTTGTTTAAYAPTGTTQLLANFSRNQGFTIAGDVLTAGAGGGVLEYGGQLIKQGARARLSGTVIGASTDRSKGAAIARLFLADAAATISVPADDSTGSGAELSIWQTKEGLPKVMAHDVPSAGYLVYELMSVFDAVDDGGRFEIDITDTSFNIHLFRSDDTEQVLNNETLWHSIARKTSGDLKAGLVTQNAGAALKAVQLTIY